jgi:RimJ/RimL family protein N-acetyltransferase
VGKYVKNIEEAQDGNSSESSASGDSAKSCSNNDAFERQFIPATLTTSSGERPPPRPDGVVIRRYCQADAQSLREFKCITVGARKWTRMAQLVIREAPDTFEEVDQQIFLAADPNGLVVGVIVFGVVNHSSLVGEIFSLGVINGWRRKRIGTELKMAALAEIASWKIAVVASTVHRANHPMLALNEKLGVQTRKDPEDPEYLLSVLVIEATD